MPLKQGSSQAVMSANIAELMKSGKHSQKQAIAIAYKEAHKDEDLTTDNARVLLEKLDQDLEADKELRAALQAFIKEGTPTGDAPKIYVVDRISVRDRSNFYAPTALGQSRRITPEGYLLCEGVPIARTGTQVYNAEELRNPDPDAPPLVPDEHGRIVVERIPSEVFREESIASGEGKDVTVQHPEEFITPETWRDESVGHLQNLRRGAGLDEDLLVADILIKSPDAIAYVNRELPEVSVGYNSEYEQVAPGRAIQRNIVINHLALVERGRAGPRCAFKDHSTEETFMAKSKSKFARAFVSLLTAFQNKDQAAVDAAIESIDESPDDDNVNGAMDAERVKKVCDWVEDRMAKDAAAEKERKEKEANDAKARDEEEKRKAAEAEGEATGDTIIEAEEGPKVLNLGKIYTGDAYKEIVSNAEVLAPGISIPSKDSLKGTRGKALGIFMRDALNTAITKDTGGELSKTFLLGRKVADLKGEALLGAFNGAAALVRVRNNSGIRAGGPTNDGGTPKPVTPAQMNEEARKYWNGRQSFP